MVDSKSISQSPWLGKRVAIVGDIILDEYVEGYVERISPEAPVPILNQTAQRYRLGGAANVALNVKRLGGEPILIGVIGDDQEGYAIKSIFKDYGIDSDRAVVCDSRCTTLKTRYVTCEGHQLLRVDTEDSKPVSAAIAEKIAQALQHLEYDVLIIADYSKGVVTDWVAQMAIDHARMHRKPSVVDPKKKDYKHYYGCTLVTPNKKEAAEALGLNVREHSGELLAHWIKDKFDFENVLVTLGAEGMYLTSRGSTAMGHVRATAREVFDVSGAGDTVVSVMALGLSAGIPVYDVAKIASVAAGVAVGHHGTYAPSWEEVAKC